uniref:Reverse transcriptase domain-containing protein n=1 Tax=Tanacetum cinerariifolium TaxID=118510 RepID=A0A6L2LRK9_TANCI|nr:hypothetical protein [Tanacetum cinerariifolium]
MQPCENTATETTISFCQSYPKKYSKKRRRDIRKRLGSRRVRSVSGSPEPRRGRPESLRKKDPERKTMFKRLENGVFHRLEDNGKSMSAYLNDSRRHSYHSSRRDTGSCYQSFCSRGTEPASEKHHNKRAPSHRTKALSESEGSVGGHWKSRSKKQRSSIEDDDLSQPWVCEETDSFTPRMRYFDLLKRTRMPSQVKTYDRSEDLEDHLNIFQAAAKLEHWAMPTWCHMFNSTLTGSARQKKCIKDLVEIHYIKLKEKEYTKDFVRRFKVESKDVKRAPEIIRISRFMHGITNPELIKRLHDKIPKSVDEMMRITTSFLRGEVAASNQERKKSLPSWKQQEAEHKQSFKKGVLKISKGKFKAPPPMTTPVEKRNNNKLCEFHGEVGHNTDECMHLKRQIEELLKNGKLSHVIKELKQNSGKNQPKANKKGETSSKDKPLTILMTPPGIKNKMVSANAPLIGFSGEIIWPLGQLSLLVKIRDEEHSTSAWMNFVVVRSSSPYNRIIGRPRVRKMQAVLSTAHGMLKFPIPGRVLTLRSSKIIPIKCAMVSGPEGQPPAAHQAMEERIRQKRISQATDRNQAIQEEVEKLINVGIMKEVSDSLDEVIGSQTTFSADVIKNTYKDEGLHDLKKFTAFYFDGCLAKTLDQRETPNLSNLCSVVEKLYDLRPKVAAYLQSSLLPLAAGVFHYVGPRLIPETEPKIHSSLSKRTRNIPLGSDSGSYVNILLRHVRSRNRRPCDLEGFLYNPFASEQLATQILMVRCYLASLFPENINLLWQDEDLCQAFVGTGHMITTLEKACVCISLELISLWGGGVYHNWIVGPVVKALLVGSLSGVRNLAMAKVLLIYRPCLGKVLSRDTQAPARNPTTNRDTSGMVRRTKGTTCKGYDYYNPLREFGTSLLW